MSVKYPLIAIAIVAATAASAQAQTALQPNLAEVARKGEAARADGTTKKATRSYSNKDLKPSPQMAAEESATGSASKTTAKEESAAEAAQAGEQQAAAQEASNDVPREEIWRLRAKRFRDQVQDIQTRLTNFTRQPENPDPARQRKLVKDIADLRLAIGTLQNQWNDFEKSARDAKIDLGWISPPPQFQQ